MVLTTTNLTFFSSFQSNLLAGKGKVNFICFWISNCRSSSLEALLSIHTNAIDLDGVPLQSFKIDIPLSW